VPDVPFGESSLNSRNAIKVHREFSHRDAAGSAAYGVSEVSETCARARARLPKRLLC